MAGKPPIQFRMSHALLEKLQAAAKSQRISLDTALSRAVVVWLRKLEGK